MAFIDVIGNNIINKILRNTDWAHSVNVFVSIHTGAGPGETGANEFTGYTGSRPGVTFDGAASKVSQNDATDLDFVAFTSGVTITFIGIWSLAAAGTFWWGGAVTPNRAVTSGDTFRLPGATGIVVTLT